MARQTAAYERSPTTPFDFIAQHQVFRVEEFEAAYREMGRKPSSARAALAYHVNQERLWVVRRGVYAHFDRIDEWLLASKLTPDAVVSHDGALSLRALAPLGDSLSFLTAQRTTPTLFEDLLCRPLRVTPRELTTDVETVQRLGQPVRVTTLERTLVDCLERLDRAPAPEDLLRIFLKTERQTSANAMIERALTFKSPLLVSRLAFFLECGKRELEVYDLQRLHKYSLRAPDYFLRSARSPEDSIISKWNLIVPPSLWRRWH